MNRRRLLIGGGALTLAGACAAYVGLSRAGTLEDYDAAVAAMRSPIAPTPQAEELIRYATLAANSHNTQPWRFQIQKDRIQIFPDFARRTPAVDPDAHHLFTSLGCAAENLPSLARHEGM
jgi:nitroreductase